VPSEKKRNSNQSLNTTARHNYSITCCWKNILPPINFFLDYYYVIKGWRECRSSEQPAWWLNAIKKKTKSAKQLHPSDVTTVTQPSLAKLLHLPAMSVPTQHMLQLPLASWQLRSYCATTLFPTPAMPMYV